MNDKLTLQLAKKLKREVQKGFGKNICKELDFNCSNCLAQALIGHLNWYIDLLEWDGGSKNREKNLHAERKKVKR